MSRQLAELLLKESLITPAQLQAADDAFRRSKEPILNYLLRTNSVHEQKILEVFSKRYKIPSFELSKYSVPEEVIKLLSRDDVFKFQLIPVEKAKGTLVVALADPTSLRFLDDIKFRTQMQVEPVLTSFSAFERAKEKYYGSMLNVQAAVDGLTKKTDSGAEKVEDLGSSNQEAVDISDENQIDAPIINLVNQVLVDSIRRKASDIHVEPYERSFRIRMRVDGVLYEALRPPYEVRNAVIARLKIMAKMDIAEKRLPQDGRIKIRTGIGEMDYRVSSMPTVYGEKIVLRLLDKSGLQTDLIKLGFEKNDLDIFLSAIHESYGMVLVTGPTGSGKTTTLYSALQELNKVSDNISTAEDPVEYNLDGINQVQTHSDIGLNFAAALRSFMRQDPDIILVGEIRDFETAEVAIQAALTGHLVLSTLHTNDAPSTVTRLLNMGIEPFLVTAAIHTVIAQRLIRGICASCRTEQPTPVNRLIQLGISPGTAKQMKIYKGVGCDACGGTGYSGRFAVFEAMHFTQGLKESVLAGANSLELKKIAIEGGMRTLRMNSLRKVAEGRTTLEEALANTANDF
jgi:type IV pilus assembly protein PilB